MKKQFVTVADLALKMDNLPEEQKSFMNNIAQMMCDVINKSREGELTSEEVEQKFTAINDQLKSYDSEKFAQVIKDNEDLVKQVKQLGETVKKLQTKGLSMEVINKFDEKIGKMLDSEKFKDFVNGLSTKSGAFDGFSLKEVSMASNYTGDVLISQQTDKVVSAVSNKKLHMRNVIATLQGDPEFPQLTYAQVYDFDRNAEFVAENGSLPESAFKVKEITAPTKRVGTHIKISKRMLKSRVWVRSYLLNKIPVMIAMAEDWNILFGDGQGENLEGIVNNENVKSIESIISNAVVTGAAGSVSAVESYNDGADTIITFAAAQPNIRSGQSIKFTGAAEGSALLTAHTLVKMNDTQVLLVGVAYAAATASGLAFEVKNQFYQNIDEPNSEDVIRTAFAVMAYGEYNPTMIVLNPSDVNTIQGEKDTTGRSLNLVTIVNGRKYIAGYLIVESTQIPVGKYFLGDTVNGASLVDYTNLSVEWAEDVETKRRNVVALIAQEEVILALYNPFAFAYGDLAQLKTAITKA